MGSSLWSRSSVISGSRRTQYRRPTPFPIPVKVGLGVGRASTVRRVTSGSIPLIKGGDHGHRLPAGNGPSPIPRRHMIRDAREPPTELNCGRQLACPDKGIADSGGIRVGDQEHLGSIGTIAAVRKRQTLRSSLFVFWAGRLALRPGLSSAVPVRHRPPPSCGDVSRKAVRPSSATTMPASLLGLPSAIFGRALASRPRTHRREWRQADSID